jgi:alginate O-acetyltransferase complex protein AlgJ
MFPFRGRFQGAIAAAFLVLLMLGSFMPDPFVGGPSSVGNKPSKLFSISYLRHYFDSNMRYAATAPMLRGLIEYSLASSSSQNVYVGRHGHLYYGGEDAAAQSAGAVYRPVEIGHFIEMVASLNRALADRNIKLVVAIPPNSQSIAARDLPWWSVQRGPLEYDLALAELQKRTITTIDLKTTLLATQEGGDLYRYNDTHWKTLGALLAYNAVVGGVGHGEWQLEPKAVLGNTGPAPEGDLAHFMGIQRFLGDNEPSLLSPPWETWNTINLLKSPPYQPLFEPYSYERNDTSGAERVLILGDSFTRGFWLPFFLRTTVETIGWMHHSKCGFDFKDIERFAPTIVILAPTEREMPCDPTQWPLGLAHATQN